MEATALPGLQFYAYMQPGVPFLVVGHTLSTIYSTTTDITNYHGKVILFTRDRTATRKCVPVVLPPLSAFAWKKCRAVNDRSKAGRVVCQQSSQVWEFVGPDPAGWDSNGAARTMDDCSPLWVAKLYHNFNGVVMPHELLAALEQYLSSPATALDNWDEWGLVQHWLLVTTQRDDNGGDPTKRQSHIWFNTGSLLSNNALIHWWTID